MRHWWSFGDFGAFFAVIAQFIGTVIIAAVAIGVIVLLVRFLLVATKAAQLYVDTHGPELVQDCVQMHGGMGVTWEHDIHLYLRRVTVNSLTYGTVADHRERLAALVIEGADA